MITAAPARRSLGACLLLLALAACGATPLPPSLAGLRRSRVMTGPRAAAMVAELHGTHVAPNATAVAVYGRGRLVVWMSHFRDGAEAHAALERMLAGMRRGDTPFVRPSEDRHVPGRWTTVGNARHHALWTSGRTLFWLEGEPGVVFRAADELPPPDRGHLV